MIKKLTVPDQNADNFFRLTEGDTGCCPDANTPACEATATYTQSNALSALVITDMWETKTLPLSPASTDAVDVRRAIETALTSAGYVLVDGEGVTVTDNGATLTVVLVGHIAPASLTHAGGSAIFDLDCTQSLVCDFVLTGYAGGDASSFETNFTANAATTNLGAVTAGTTTAAALKTAVEGALTAGSVTGGTVTVTTSGVGAAQRYTIRVSGVVNTAALSLSGKGLERQNCRTVYT